MGRDSDVRQPGKNMFGHAVVDYAFARNRAFFLGIKCGCVVLEILDQRAGFGTLVKNLGLAFVDFAAAGHNIGT